jgi:hypothetical protein
MISFWISVVPPKMNGNQTQLDALLAENLVPQFCVLGERGTDLVAAYYGSQPLRPVRL